MLRVKKLGKDIVKLLMKNSKGQALVEFVIILPIIMMIIFVVIDFSNVFYQKNNLENVLNTVVSYKQGGKTDNYIDNKLEDNIDVSYVKDNSNLIIKVTKKVKLVTPFSSMFFDNPYTISTERVIIYE